MHMPEPTSSSAAGGYAAYKIAIAMGLPASLAAVVVMLYAQPESKREWTVALICTVMSSICGGAAVVQHYGLQAWVDTYMGLTAMAGIIFACGLPGWVVVRWVFAWVEKRKDKDVAEVAAEIKAAVKELT